MRKTIRNGNLSISRAIYKSVERVFSSVVPAVLGGNPGALKQHDVAKLLPKSAGATEIARYANSSYCFLEIKLFLGINAWKSVANN